MPARHHAQKSSASQRLRGSRPHLADQVKGLGPKGCCTPQETPAVDIDALASRPGHGRDNAIGKSHLSLPCCMHACMLSMSILCVMWVAWQCCIDAQMLARAAAGWRTFRCRALLHRPCSEQCKGCSCVVQVRAKPQCEQDTVVPECGPHLTNAQTSVTTRLCAFSNRSWKAVLEGLPAYS